LTVSSAAVAVVEDTGGGGGGGGGSGPVSNEFSVSEDSFNVRSVVGDLRTRKMVIKNLGSGVLTFRLRVEGDDVEEDGAIKGFSKVVILSEDSFYLSEGEEKEVEVKIIVPDSSGVYVGTIIVDGGGVEKEVLVAINTQSKKTLFDISSTPLDDEVGTGENFRTQMYLLPVGEKGVDVTIKYSVRGYSGRIYYEESSTFYVDGEMSFVKSFETDDLEDGDYVLAAEMVYVGGFASASSQFSVGERGVYDSIFSEGIYLIGLALSIIMVFIVVLIKLIEIKKYKRRKKK